MIIISEIH